MFLFQKGAFFKRTKVALFISNSFEKRKESIDLPFFQGIKEQSDKDAIALMRAMKRRDYWPSLIPNLFGFAVFFLLSLIQTDINTNLDLAALIFTILCQLGAFLNKQDPLLRIRIKQRTLYLYKDTMFKGVQEVVVFYISLLISYSLMSLNIGNEWLSKFSIAILFLCMIINILEKDQ